MCSAQVTRVSLLIQVTYETKLTEAPSWHAPMASVARWLLDVTQITSKRISSATKESPTGLPELKATGKYDYCMLERKRTRIVVNRLTTSNKPILIGVHRPAGCTHRQAPNPVRLSQNFCSNYENGKVTCFGNLSCHPNPVGAYFTGSR